MPRSFDSDSASPGLAFTENVECPRCGEIFEGDFVDHTQSLSVQDMVVAPFGDHECVECGYRWITTMTGWMFYSEAG